MSQLDKFTQQLLTYRHPL